MGKKRSIVPGFDSFREFIAYIYNADLDDKPKHASGGPVEPGFYILGRGDEKEAFKAGNATEPIQTDDKDFGKRLRAALESLPDEMRNDPAYADPVAWVKRARENDAPLVETILNIDDPEIPHEEMERAINADVPLFFHGIQIGTSKMANGIPDNALACGYIVESKNRYRLVDVSITDPVYAAKLRESMSNGAQWGMSIGFKPDKSPMVVKRNVTQRAFSNARALVRRLFKDSK